MQRQENLLFYFQVSKHVQWFLNIKDSQDKSISSVPKKHWLHGTGESLNFKVFLFQSVLNQQHDLLSVIIKRKLSRCKVTVTPDHVSCGHVQDRLFSHDDWTAVTMMLWSTAVNPATTVEIIFQFFNEIGEFSRVQHFWNLSLKDCKISKTLLTMLYFFTWSNTMHWEKLYS